MALVGVNRALTVIVVNFSGMGRLCPHLRGGPTTRKQNGTLKGKKNMSGSRNRIFKHLALAGACLSLGACASTGPESIAPESGYEDPFEQTNRAIFEFNDALDQAVFKPSAETYRDVVPQAGRTGIRNFLRNLRGPVNAANQLLQGDIEGFAGDTIRVMVNTTFGIGGLIDIADAAGFPYEQEDFGQTLGKWGVPHGPYVMLPILGPGSLRDHTAFFAESFADPVNLYLVNVDEERLVYARLGMAALDKREELLGVLDDLRANAIDYYATVRSVSYQRREALLHDQNPDEASAAPAIPDYSQGEE